MMELLQQTQDAIQRKEFKECLRNNDFERLYQLLDSADELGIPPGYHADVTGEVTELFYSFDIDPLMYLNEIPKYYLYCSSNGVKDSLIVPSNIQRIRNGAFVQSDVKKVVLPNLMNYIDQQAFYDSDVQSVVFPKHLTSINERAFKSCKNLTEVYINQVQIIQDQAFSNSNVKEVQINCIPFLGEQVFAQCSELKKVTIRGPITSNHSPSVSARAFQKCENLEEVELGEGFVTFDILSFATCESIRSIEIPSSVEEISASAFAGCKSLERVTFKNSNNWYRNGKPLDLSDEHKNANLVRNFADGYDPGAFPLVRIK